ncbi:hypothetical protein [Arthrobacter sp. KK5.5]|uniref:hypothetical protein n=1 Tax=Arthrobacter sp. KK5.5 TaxID=3373084 RepID=UPI003EE57BF6
MRTLANRISVGLLTAAVAAMVLIPAVNAFKDSDQMFGWQMYARMTAMPTVSIEHANGSVEDMPLALLVSRVRPEVDYFATVPEHVCKTVETARIVRIARDTPREGRTLTC